MTSGTHVYVGNLAWSITTEDLSQFLAAQGAPGTAQSYTTQSHSHTATQVPQPRPDTCVLSFARALSLSHALSLSRTPSPSLSLSRVCRCRRRMYVFVVAHDCLWVCSSLTMHRGSARRVLKQPSLSRSRCNARLVAPKDSRLPSTPLTKMPSRLSRCGFCLDHKIPFLSF